MVFFFPPNPLPKTKKLLFRFTNVCAPSPPKNKFKFQKEVRKGEKRGVLFYCYVAGMFMTKASKRIALITKKGPSGM
jgi:hypothetical protein